MALVLIALVVALVAAFYLYSTWTFSRFKGTKVPHLKPYPIVGNMLKFFLKKEDALENFGKFYEIFPNDRIVGLYQMRSPTFMIRDPELIRQIGVKDFETFSHHMALANGETDPLFGNNLFGLKGQKWRDMRATLSPAFTGSKMRLMFELVFECGQQMNQYLHKMTAKDGHVDFELKNLFTKYTNDVIATSAFGIKVDSLENPENIFYAMGKKITNFSGLSMSLKFFGYILMPKVMQFFKIKIIDDECGTFFHNLVHETMSVREKEGIVRPDMINLLMQARKGALQHDSNEEINENAGFATVQESVIGKTPIPKRAWTDEEFTAQAVIFFLAGFESVSVALCFIAHELAVNPDPQKKLQEEIDRVCQELHDKQKTLDYEAINQMKYLDMVISEGLRLWPPSPFTDRICNKNYIVEDYNGNEIEIRKGEPVLIPFFKIHRDEKYFPNPNTFEPERFSNENKDNIKPFTYMPFGLGPRNCIGSRFALMELKAMLFNILKDFNIVPCKKTQIPLKFRKGHIQLMPSSGGFWVKFERRSK